MLFNSFEFIFAFLPLTLLGFYVLGRPGRLWALSWLCVASFVFYAWWRPVNVLIIAPSIIINFVIACWLQRLRLDERRPLTARLVLLLGIVFNVAFLGYFKYADFLRGVSNDLFATDFVLTHVILPLGISFITFQKIAFLIDVHSGRVKSFGFGEYCLFVLFFPQLIAGPIVHYQEVMPQFRAVERRPGLEDVAVGLTLFAIGLFKKSVIADSLSPLVASLYQHAADGRAVSLIPAWMAALGFTLQIYFDFSGYSDMALGLARFFGVRLPANFDSPLRARSIIDFWLRWHMTLTRYLTAYIYNPLVLVLTRRWAAKGRPPLGGRNTSLGAFLELLMVPTLITMFVSGLWHGAGYVIVLWGLLHGVYLAINHAWRIYARRLWRNPQSYARFMNPIAWPLTFVAVAVAMVLFRSSSVGAAWDLLKGMAGLNGVGLPATIYGRLGPLAAWAQGLGVIAEAGSGRNFLMLASWIAVLMLVVMLLPNSLRLMASFEPALGIRPPAKAGPAIGGRVIQWRASLPWALGVSVLAAIAILCSGGAGEFLYWQF